MGNPTCIVSTKWELPGRAFSRAYANASLAQMGGVESIDSLIGVSIKSFMPSDERYETFKEREKLVMEKGEKDGKGEKGGCTNKFI